MPDTFEIEIATPERLLARETAITAQIPAKEGYIGVLPEHAPLLSELGIGVLTFITLDDHCHSMAIYGGFLEILNNHVRVLADEGQIGREIDVAKAEQDYKQAQDMVADPARAIDIADALIAVNQAQARIEAGRKAAANEDCRKAT